MIENEGEDEWRKLAGGSMKTKGRTGDNSRKGEDGRRRGTSPQDVLIFDLDY